MAEATQVSSEAITAEIEKYIDDLGALRDEYKQKYEEMKEIEKQITIKAGAISALKSLIETEDVPAKENSEGEGI